MGPVASKRSNNIKKDHLADMHIIHQRRSLVKDVVRPINSRRAKLSLIAIWDVDASKAGVVASVIWDGEAPRCYRQYQELRAWFGTK